MKLLVSTPLFLLGFDTATRRTEVLASGDGEYYGISWDRSGRRLVLSHSAVDNADFVDLATYAQSERGYLTIAGESGWRFLSLPHQILWVDDEWIVATNTGRNAIAKIRATDGAAIQYRFDELLWDRLTPLGREGVHYNSLFYQKGILYVVASNFDKGSFILSLAWPEMREIGRISVPASGIHNLWIDRRGHWVTCASSQGTLIDARTGEVLWRGEGEDFTRGMAATDAMILVGASSLDVRSRRNQSESGIWLVDAHTWQTLDYFYLGHFGCVHDVRIIDLPDLCHNGVPLDGEALFHLTPAREEIATAKLAKARQRISALKRWNLHAGAAAGLEDPVIRPGPGDFLLAALRDENIEAAFVTARLHLGSSWRSGDYAGLVACYRGPGDKNMVAALFQRAVNGGLIASIWLEQGEWRMLADTLLPGEMKTPGSDADKMGNREEALPIGLSVEEDRLDLTVKGISVLSLQNSAFRDKGSWGIRMMGASFAVGDVVLQPRR